MRVNILVYSNSKNADVLRIFLSQLQNFLILDSPQKPKVVVLYDKNSEGMIPQLTGVDLQFIQYQEDEGFSNNLLRARNYLDEYFIYMQDDFFLHADISCSQLAEYIETINNSQFQLYRLIPSGHGRSRAYWGYYRNSSRIAFRGGNYFLIDYLSKLPACMQSTVWETETFMKMHDQSQIQNLRDEWHVNYRNFFKMNRVKGLAARSPVMPYITVTAVKRGKWNFLDTYYADILINILKIHGVNPLDRGVFLTSRRISEPKSNFLKDIWRRFRYGL